MKFDKTMLAGLFVVTALVIFLCSSPTGREFEPHADAYVALNIHYERQDDRMVPAMEGHSNLTTGHLDITLACPGVDVIAGRKNAYTERVRLTQYGYFNLAFEHTAYLLLKNEGKPHATECNVSVRHSEGALDGLKSIDTVWALLDEYIEVVQFP